jgi:uncharacterized protein (TIGR03437 family)
MGIPPRLKRRNSDGFPSGGKYKVQGSMFRGRNLTHIRLTCALAMLCVAPIAHADLSGASTAPLYTTGSIVQAADQATGILAPNAIATIYGTNLSFSTHALMSSDLDGGDLPLSLVGVSVYVNGLQANLFYVSPGQINFLIPYEITSSSATLFVNRDGITGPTVTIQLAVTAPAFFQWNGNLAVAEHANGALITPSNPAQSGEIIVLYAAGLGRTSPDISSGFIPQTALSILYLSQLQILLNGIPCPPQNILYAGVTPGFAGLYQINLQLPAALPLNPQIQMSIGAQTSPAAVQLPVQ